MAGLTGEGKLQFLRARSKGAWSDEIYVARTASDRAKIDSDYAQYLVSGPFAPYFELPVEAPKTPSVPDPRPAITPSVDVSPELVSPALSEAGVAEVLESVTSEPAKS